MTTTRSASRERRSVPGAAVSHAPNDRGWWARHPRAVQLVSVAALVLGVVYLVWRIGWSLAGVPLVLGVALLAAELFGWVSLAFYAFLAWSVPRSRRPPPLPRVSVDVFVCTYDEPASVVEATLVGCDAITTPHTTYLLDDGGRREMAVLAHRLGAQYIARTDNTHAKAGNVNHALDLTHGDLVLVLDADHVPFPHILEATTGYFADPDVAVVQTPHEFSNRDSVQHTKVERHEQSLFYDVIAPGKNRHNAAFWCGSGAVIRRQALVEVGGVLTDTIAEDFHTTLAMHARGWQSHYHHEVLVQGRAPHDLAGFLLQRARWARGNLRVFRTRENPIICRGLSLGQRLSYFASLFNYFACLQRLALLLVLAAVLATGELPMHANAAVLVGFWLPWSLAAFFATMALSRGTLGPLDSSRYGLLTMGVNLRGVASLFYGRVGKFAVTPKEGTDPGGLRVLRMQLLVSTLGGVLAVLVGLRLLDAAGVVAMPAMPAFAAVVTVALGFWELYCIAAALVPLVRRRQLRTRYRVPVSMRGRIADTTIRVDILDLTPDGLALECGVEVRPGVSFPLLTRVTDAAGTLHDVTLPVEVRSCAPAAEVDRFRVGCALGPLDRQTRRRIVEFCEVAVPVHQHTGATSVAPSGEPDQSGALTA